MPDDTIRERIRRKIRVRRPGFNADADIQADIAVNVSRSRSVRSSAERQQDRPTDERRTDVPPIESEGGER